MHTVILAAGLGTRLWPYGETWPKAALPIANRPLVRHLLDAARAAGADEVTVVIGHLAGQVRAALVDEAGIRFVTQTSPLGTATALTDALDSLPAAPEPVLVLHGDVLLDAAELRRLIAAFETDPSAAAAALVTPLGGEDPRDWIGAELDGGLLKQALGHPRDGTYRVAGAYLLAARALPYVRANPGTGVRVEVGTMPPLEADLNESLNLLLDDGQRVLAVEAEGACLDVDKPWHLAAANFALADRLFDGLTKSRLESCRVSPEADIDALVIAEEGTSIGPRTKLRGRIYLGRGSCIDNGAMVEGTVVIGEDCVLRDYCQVGGAVIGRGCRVCHCAEVSGVLMEGCYLYHYMEFSGVMGRHSDLGAATVCGTLRFDDGSTAHRVKGRWETPGAWANATYLGDYTRTGVNAILMPGVKVGPYSLVGPGVVLSEDLPSHTCRLLQQDYVDKPWGPERYGW